MSIRTKLVGGTIAVATVVSLSGALSPHQHPRTAQAGGNDVAAQYAGEQDREAENRHASQQTMLDSEGDANAGVEAGAGDVDEDVIKDLLFGGR